VTSDNQLTLTGEHVTFSVIQVGDNVTSVDVRTADWPVATNAPVTLNISCPRGWPVLTVDMGDGQPPLLLTHPAAYDPDDHDRVLPPSRTRGSPVSSISSPPTAARRRRDAPETSTIGQPFIVTYQYRTAGSYRYACRSYSFSAL